MSALKRIFLLLCPLLVSFLLLLPLTIFAHSNRIILSAYSMKNEPVLADGIGLRQPAAAILLAESGGVTATRQTIFLPLVSKPFEIVAGEIKLVVDDAHTSDKRARGVTTFVQTATLDFSDLQFSNHVQPTYMIISGDTITPSNLITFTKTVEIGLQNPIAGAHVIDVLFEHNSFRVSQTFTIFYIPNGDFSNIDDGTGLSKWGAQTVVPPDENEKNIFVAVGAKNLRLGLMHPQNSCEAEQRVAGIKLALFQIPTFSDYHLHIEGRVITQDQNPSNDATYDAFEILINGNVIERFSNQETPINCNGSSAPITPISRNVPVNAQISLHNYSGEIELSLENHLRFDSYFNTYTEIDMVWIDN